MQTNDEKKIANCPFCRATAQLYIRNNQYAVRCNNHNCIAYDIEPHFVSADAAISAWNASKRATTDAQEVKAAYWEWFEDWGFDGEVTECSDAGYRCSDCKTVPHESLYFDNPNELPPFRYCPHCGCLMKEYGK